MTSSSAGGELAAAPERKLVRTAELHLEVASYANARAKMDAELARLGGYVAQARVEHADGAVAAARLELRVPAPELERFMSDSASLGRVLYEDVQSREISDEYYDAEARLANARRLEQRLLEFADNKAADVKGLLEVERELGRVREDIETLQGRLKGYAERVALSSLSLQLTSRERVSIGDPPGLGSDLKHALVESSRGVLQTARSTLLVAAALLPWLPLIGLLAYLGRRVARRARRGAAATSAV
jgi:hypothetical protein